MAVVNTKIVNIKATIPIRDTAPPIYGIKQNVKMTYSDILKCLCKRAIVEQVLSDGTTVRLTTKNFRDDFEAELKKKKTLKFEEPEVKHTGSIESIDFASQIDDDEDDDNHSEPEEPKNTITTRRYIDGLVVDYVGVEPTVRDTEDESHVSIRRYIDGTVTENGVIVEPKVKDESVDTEESVKEEEPKHKVNTIETPVDTSVNKKNSSKKSNSKKKK